MKGNHWRRIRWVFAGALLAFGAGLILVSAIAGRPVSCAEVSRLDALPSTVEDLADQRADVPLLPLEVCEPIDIIAVLPLGVTALFLLLPDFREVGFGGLALKRFEERIVDQVEGAISNLQTVISDAAGVKKDIDAGVLRKGKIRNVELRVQTVQEILLSALLAPPTNRDAALYEAGTTWGMGWSRDFVNIVEGAGVGTLEGIRKVLDDWAYYDATAGMGRIEFVQDARGLPTAATVHNSFLAIERDGADLRSLFAGYLAGSLTGLLSPVGATVDVGLREKAVDRDVYEVTCVLAHVVT